MSWWKRSSAPLVEPAGVTLLRDGELGTRLEAVLANATDHIRRERELLSGGTRIPPLPRKMRGRPMVVVSRDHHWQDDLLSLKRWIKDRDPVLIGVGKGTESLLDAGYRPDVVIGSLDEISDLALNEAREVVVTAPSVHAKDGADRFEKAGVDVEWFIATGSSADLGLLLAEGNGAPAIVVAGGPSDLAERFAGPPDEAATAFVARLRANAHVVDAKAVGFLSAKPASTWPVLLFLLGGLVAVGAAIVATPVGHDWGLAAFDYARGLIPT